MTRPAVARVINEDNYNAGVVRYVNNGSVVFVAGESSSTLWPGIIAIYLLHIVSISVAQDFS